MATTVKNISELRTLPEIDTTDPDEVEKRIQEYFDYCITHELRPTISLLAAALGVDRVTVWRWSQEGNTRGKVITRARGIIEALLEEWGVQGKLNPATMCFLLKNHFGYSDTYTLEAVQANPLGDIPNAKEIVKRLPKITDDIDNTEEIGDLLD